MNNAVEYIERYFKGELTPPEKQAFESRCLSDPGFAKQVAFYILMHDQLNQQWTQQKKQEFAELRKTEPPIELATISGNGEFKSVTLNEGNDEWQANVEVEQQNVLTPRKETSAVRSSYKKAPGKLLEINKWTRLAIAASVLGIIALGITLYVQNNNGPPTLTVNRKIEDTSKRKITTDTVRIAQKNIPVDTPVIKNVRKPEVPKKWVDKPEQEQLVAENFKPDAPPKDAEGLLAEAFDQYKAGNYQEASQAYEDAIAIVDNITLRSEEDEEEQKERKLLLFYSHYYNALSLMADGKHIKAISELKAIKNSPDRFWQSKVQWYLALAYLKTGRVEMTEELLQKVSANKQAGEYRQKAITLSRNLKHD